MSNIYHEFPSKWCVIRNKDTYIEVNRWFNSRKTGIKFTDNGEYSFQRKVDYLHYPMNNRRYIHSGVREGYTLITYDDFLLNVVNQQTIEENSYQIY